MNGLNVVVLAVVEGRKEGMAVREGLWKLSASWTQRDGSGMETLLSRQRNVVFAWIDGAKHSALVDRLFRIAVGAHAVVIVDPYISMYYSVDINGMPMDAFKLASITESLEAVFDGRLKVCSVFHCSLARWKSQANSRESISTDISARKYEWFMRY